MAAGENEMKTNSHVSVVFSRWFFIFRWIGSWILHFDFRCLHCTRQCRNRNHCWYVTNSNDRRILYSAKNRLKFGTYSVKHSLICLFLPIFLPLPLLRPVPSPLCLRALLSYPSCPHSTSSLLISNSRLPPYLLSFSTQFSLFSLIPPKSRLLSTFPEWSIDTKWEQKHAKSMLKKELAKRTKRSITLKL